MHVTLVEINVHEDKVDEFIEVFRQNHLGSVQEEGNLQPGKLPYTCRIRQCRFYLPQ